MGAQPYDDLPFLAKLGRFLNPRSDLDVRVRLADGQYVAQVVRPDPPATDSRPPDPPAGDSHAAWCPLCAKCGNAIECKPADLLHFPRTQWLRCCGEAMTLFTPVPVEPPPLAPAPPPG